MSPAKDSGRQVRCIMCREKIPFKEELNVDGMKPVCSDSCREAYVEEFL